MAKMMIIMLMMLMIDDGKIELDNRAKRTNHGKQLG